MPDLRPHLPGILGASAFWLVLFVGYALFVARQPQIEPITILPPEEVPAGECASLPSDSPTPTPTPTPSPLRVYVSGEVQKPGVYRLPPESLVVDAIEQAGGATNQADLVAINLAHPLTDGEQIYVPSQEESSGPPPPVSGGNSEHAKKPSSAQELTRPVDVNTASAEELEQLPGIGPAMAQRIIEGRPYSSVEDLLRVKGIGEATLKKLRPYIEVR